MIIAWQHLSVSPLAFSFHLHFPFEPLDWNSQLHLALVSLLRTAHCQLPSASLICISQFHLSCAYLICTSHVHLSHLNLWMSPLMCISLFHLWYATLTSALSCTSPWNIWFAIVDYKFSFETLIRASWLHSFLPRRCCTCHLHLSFATSSSALMGSCRSHLSVTTLIGTSRATSMRTLQFHRSVELVVRAFCSHLSMTPVIFASPLIISVGPFS